MDTRLLWGARALFTPLREKMFGTMNVAQFCGCKWASVNRVSKLLTKLNQGVYLRSPLTSYDA